MVLLRMGEVEIKKLGGSVAAPLSVWADASFLVKIWNYGYKKDAIVTHPLRLLRRTSVFDSHKFLGLDDLNTIC